MKVLVRDQITEVITTRTVFHSIEYKGKKYSRVLKAKTEVPYMDEHIVIHKPRINWLELTNGNVLSAIDKSLAKELETEYQKLDTREKNGDFPTPIN